ncbi:MAG: Por secretion system protein [Prevotella sp.]|nr:Por secretion system protein [Prevotella sp.]
MKHLIITVLTILFAIHSSAQSTGKWKIFPAYGDTQAVDSVAPDCIFVLSSGNIYRVNAKDWSVTTYDKLTGLNDTGIAQIAWNSVARRLVIVYDNSNIDLMTKDGDVTNVPDLYHKSTTLDKSINGIDVFAQYAYISTAFGIVKLDVRNSLISDSYILNKSILQTSIKDGSIYAKAKDGSIMKASLSSNLVDRTQWAEYSGQTSGLFPSKTIDKELAKRMEKMRPDGPRQLAFGIMKVKNDCLYAVLGNSWGNVGYDVPHIYDIKNDKWTFLSDGDGAIKAKTGVPEYNNMMDIDVAPADPKHISVGAKYALYDFSDGNLGAYYVSENSPIKTAAKDNPKYILPSAISYANDGTLWLFASQTIDGVGLFSISKSGELTSYKDDKWIYNDISLGYAKNMFFDSKGRLWWCNNHWWKPSLNCYDPKTDTRYSYSSFVNEDGTSLTINNVRCAAEDRDGNIWIGTNVGPLMLEKDKIGDDSNVIWNQVKVPRNDGTNLADYLLSGIDIYCMAIDGANRKWFGSNGNGIYVIGQDNITQEYHFTSDNSPLLSDDIMGIAIDKSRGDVYIGTTKGLCSYRSDASEAVDVMDKDNVYAYPNPVTPDYTGLITVRGLSYDADIKITTASGSLVASGRSNGGTFTWDGCDSNGKPVASGVYMVCIATSEGKSGVVTRIGVVR